MTKYLFIVNPNARNGTIGKMWPKVEEEILIRGMNHSTFYTQEPRHAEEIAREEAKNFDVIVATGGDGTVNEVFLYIDNKLVRREGGAPYEWGTANANQENSSLLNLSAGTHVLKAEAVDDKGAKGYATLSVTVSGDTNPNETDNFVDGPGKIIYPWRATTALLKGGESFQVMFNSVANQTVKSALLRGPFNKVNTTINVTTGNWVYDKTSGVI